MVPPCMVVEELKLTSSPLAGFAPSTGNFGGGSISLGTGLTTSTFDW